LICMGLSQLEIGKQYLYFLLEIGPIRYIVGIFRYFIR
jgi:hypothetical protein